MATKKDVRVKVRLNVLSVLLKDKGDADQRPGREGSQRKTIIDVPTVEISSDELETRLEKAQQVLETGFWVDPDDIPPQTVTDDAGTIATTSVVLHGHVKSGTALIAAACGFQYGLTPALGTTVAADQSPVASANNTSITKTVAGLTANTKYYFRVYATDANFSGGKYGIVKSFKTLPTP
jgi:hypothetical protein